MHSKYWNITIFPSNIRKWNETCSEPDEIYIVYIELQRNVCTHIELETWNEFIETSSISSSIRNLDVKLDSDSQVYVGLDPIPIWRS